MNKKNISIGIDIGTQSIKIIIIGYKKENNSPYLLATGISDTYGMRQGYIVNTDKVGESIKKAVKQAEVILGYKIHKTNISIGGINLASIVSTGSIIISKADQEITQLDISKVIALTEENLDLVNKKIIHMIPLSYKLDGKEINGRPKGMNGIKLEVKVLFITCLKQNIEDLITACALSNIEVSDVIASPIALSTILLNPKQKKAGCALLDIGAETVSMTVFEDNILIYLKVFPIGSMDITNDIALGLKIGLDEAESIKLGSVIGGDFSKRKIDEIIDARLVDIFELVGNHLKRIKRNELLPAGIIITGGGANIDRIEEIARKQLNLPAKVGPMDTTIKNKFKIKDSSWYVSYGLALLDTDGSTNIKNSITDNLKQIKSFFKSIFSQLLP